MLIHATMPIKMHPPYSILRKNMYLSNAAPGSHPFSDCVVQHVPAKMVLIRGTISGWSYMKHATSIYKVYCAPYSNVILDV